MNKKVQNMPTQSIISNNSVLEIKGLNVSFNNSKPSSHVVKDVHLQIKQGEVLGVVGESGSGKTLTALSVLGLCPPQAVVTATEGLFFYSEKFGNIDILKIKNKQLQYLRGAEISIIFQEPMTSLNPVLRCGNQVMENIIIHKKISKKAAKQKVTSLFEEVQLPEPEKIFKSFPHQLSGGQKQRVMISMALSCRPRLLIADEPTTALDVSVQKSILQLIRFLQQKYNMSVLFITHDLRVVSEICDRVAVMQKGEVVESLKSIHLFKAIHPYTKGLIACRPPTDSRPKLLPTVQDFIADENFLSKQSADSLYKSERHSSENKEVILSVENLTTAFPLKINLFGSPVAFLKAVDNVSFDVFRGETMGLVGESGCGKTSLSRTILRLLDLSYGKIIFNNQDVSKLKGKKLKNLRKNCQIIFQDPYSSLNPNLTAGEAILEPMRVHNIEKNDKSRKDYIINILKKVELSENDFNKYPHQFSGGQRQRIVIARALVLNPSFIICDEAVSSLDVSVQAQVLNLLNSLKQDFNLTYLFISHDLSVVKFMSDRIMVMEKGKIVETGKSADVFQNPQNQYTKKLIESIPGIYRHEH